VTAEQIIFGDRLRCYRLTAGLRGAEVAAVIGISGSTYSRIETGHRSLTIVQLRGFAAAVGIDSWTVLEQLGW